ncbi:hypothetical protein [Gimesia sp.]|uniref:hypothetical protein n=1 Tax=Gimesia sp. TaxID=2024833 RepID=UPI003A903995
MKFLLTGILLLCCFHSTVSADSFTIGDKTIEVPAPAGYVRVTPEMGDVYRLARSLVDPANDLLAYYIPESDVAAAKAGEIPPLNRTFMLKVNKQLKTAELGTGDFAKLKKGAVEENRKITETLKKQLPDLFDKVNQGISKEFNMDFAMQVSQVVPLDPHYDVPNAMAFSMFVTYNVSAEGEKSDDVVCCTTTFLDADGKVLFLYCYAPQDELSWTQSAAKDWAESVMASNPKPPTGTVQGGGIRKYRGMVKWIIAGVVFLLISVFKGRGSKSA